MRQYWIETIEMWLGDWTKSDFGFRTIRHSDDEIRLYLNSGEKWYFSFYSHNKDYRSRYIASIEDADSFELRENEFAIDGGSNEEKLEDLCKDFYYWIICNKGCFADEQGNLFI